MPLKVMADSQLQATFGLPELVELPGNQFKIVNGWEKKNLVRIFVPQLAGVQALGTKFSGNITFNKLAAPQLLASFQAIEKAGLVSKILSYSGSFKPRRIRGSKKVSRHTY